MRAMAILVLVLSGMAVRADEALPPPPPKADWPESVPLAYPDLAAARKAWAPMTESAPVSRVKWEGCQGLRMTCNLSGTKMERASWDAAVKLDLSVTSGMQFQFYCPDPSPVSYFGLYLRSGAGWYSTTFAPEAAGKWGVIRFNKMDMRVEGKPAGWDQIEGLRISAWRGSDQDTSFYIANLGYIPSDSPLVVVWGEWAAGQFPQEARVVTGTAHLVASCLQDTGLSFGLIADSQLTAERLSGRKVAILPYSPKLPDGARNALAKFIEGGGKLLSFYRFPAGLQEQLGMTPGRYLKESAPGQFCSIRRNGEVMPDLPENVLQGSRNIETVAPVAGRSEVAAYWHDVGGASTGQPALVVSDTGIHMTHVLIRDDIVNKRALLLAMVGRFAPECWAQSAQWHLEQAGAVGPYASFEKAQTAIAEKTKRDTALKALEEAENLRKEASTLINDKQYSKAIAAATAMHGRLVEAYCAAQRSVSGEHRAFWCHDAFGVMGMTWDAAIKNLAENGFTDILPNMAWGGTAYYSSEVLPVAPEVRVKGDQISACLAACKKYEVACHVWKVCWNMGGHAPAAFREQMKAERRTQVKFDGTEEPDWLCPSHPANQKLEIDAMAEIAAKYEVDGVHFDYIRYPDRLSCYCDGCRERFEKKLGKKAAKWPQAVMDSPDLRDAWLDFRREQITKVVAGVHEKVRKAKPKVKISAAVFPNLIQDRDNVGQDWGKWCEKGYLDFVCPMDYTSSNAQFENQVKQQKEWAGKVPCYPGIGLSLWTDPDPVCRLIDQIEITRKHKTGGFTVFNYATREATEILPQCGAGITRKSASAKK